MMGDDKTGTFNMVDGRVFNVNQGVFFSTLTDFFLRCLFFVNFKQSLSHCALNRFGFKNYDYRLSI